MAVKLPEALGVTVTVLEVEPTTEVTLTFSVLAASVLSETVPTIAVVVGPFWLHGRGDTVVTA